MSKDEIIYRLKQELTSKDEELEAKDEELRTERQKHKKTSDLLELERSM